MEWARGAQVLRQHMQAGGVPSPQRNVMPTIRHIRIIRHSAVPDTGSYEVKFADGRPSRYFYFDDIPGRRLRPDILTSEQALITESDGPSATLAPPALRLARRATSLRNDNEISSDSIVPKLILLGTSGKMARQIPAPGAGLQHMRRNRHAHA